MLLGGASGLGKGDSGDILLECCRVEIAAWGMEIVGNSTGVLQGGDSSLGNGDSGEFYWNVAGWR